MSCKTVEIMPADEEFADVERYHLTPGLFRMNPKTSEVKGVKIRYDIPQNGGYLEIVAFEALRPFDAMLLCAILQQGAKHKIEIWPDTESWLGKELRSQLELMEDAAKKKCMAYQTSARALIKDMGLAWHGQRSIDDLTASIKRMYHVSFALERRRNGHRELDLFRLLSHVRLQGDEDMRISFGINVLLAEALLTPGHFARIDMKILRKLNSQKKLMFIALSNAIDPGKHRWFAPDNLREFLYGPKDKKMAQNTERVQTCRAKKAAKELASEIGWQWEEKNGSICITRPAIRGQKHRKKPKKGKKDDT